MDRNPDKNSRENLTQLYSGGRSTLLAVILFTLVNLVMMLLELGSYFLFSASIPYYLTLFGVIFDAYGEGSTYTVTALAISAVILLAYLGCWFFSKGKSGWLTAATVFFALDTAALVYIAFFVVGDVTACLLDLVFHALVLYQMIRGILAGAKLKKLPEEIPEAPETPTIPQSPEL